MKIKYLASIFTLLPMLFSCQQEDVDQPGTNNKAITITLDIPYVEDAGSPATYAMPGDEGKVNTVDLLAFETDPANPNDPTKGTYFYRATVGNLIGNPTGATFNTVLRAHDKNQTLVVLVNCRPEINAKLNLISGVTTKQDVVNKLILERNTAFDPTTNTSIPMWGEITNQNITANYNPPGGLNVKLTRMLAKINISNAVNTATFALTRAWLYNPRQKGSVIPALWDEVGNVATKPTSVAGSEMAQGANFGAFWTSNPNEIKNKIYTFEANNADKAKNNLLDATCLVVAGRYNGNGQWSYYRIDLKNYTTGEFYDVLRNHSYNITITAVGDEGATNPDDAFNGISRITANVEVWNEATGQAQYGSDHLYVSQRNITVLKNGADPVSGSSRLEIKTSNEEGWKFSDDPTTKMTLEWANPDRTIGPANTPFTVKFSPVNSAIGRDGKAIIISGNLSYTINIAQDDCGRNGIGLRQKIGLHEYLTHAYPTGINGSMECWMVENIRETPDNRAYPNSPDIDTYGQMVDLHRLHPNGMSCVADATASEWVPPTLEDLQKIINLLNNNANYQSSKKFWLVTPGNPSTMAGELTATSNSSAPTNPNYFIYLRNQTGYYAARYHHEWAGHWYQWAQASKTSMSTMRQKTMLGSDGYSAKHVKCMPLRCKKPKN